MGNLGCERSGLRVEDSRPPQAVQVADESRRFEAAPALKPIDQSPVSLTTPPASTQPSMEDVLWVHLPDPIYATQAFDHRIAATRFSPSIKREYERIYEDAKVLIKEIERPKQFRLSLADALRRALAHNYQIIVDGFAPAISTAQVVQAEAAFDEAFFFNANRNNTDQMQPFIRKTPALQRAFETDTTIVNGGVRKLLATGATVTLTQQMTRVDNPSTVYRQWNPLWAQNFIAELRQPILRNFGIDFNRAQINIRKNEQIINQEVFRARVIDTLNQTERNYWALVGARRDVVSTAELVAEAVLTLRQIEARKDFDSYQTLLFRSQAAVKQREFEYIDVKNRVRNAEDQLLNFINDPDLPLSADYEIIPSDNPTVQEVVRDRFHEVQTALERRPEIIQGRLGVDVTRINLGIAKNQALPRLDAIYRMTLNGLGPSADRAFDKETSADFIDQFVGVEFAWNFGERAERAGIRIAALQQSQAVARYKKALDDVITDCRVALRNLETSFRQLTPSYEGVIAASENLRSLQERQERKSPAELDTVLNAQVNLFQSRRALLQAVVAYNQGVVDVERAKGTLLEFNNVVLSEQP
jgi:outer membrane protein